MGSQGYIYQKTGIGYVPDEGFTETGENNNITTKVDETIEPYLENLRSFPKGKRNCYTLKPKAGRNNTYLVRATFLYGNYDFKNSPPTFELHLGTDLWTSVTFYSNYTLTLRPEIIYIPSTDYIDVCLVNTDQGVPFISALELRLLNNDIYKTNLKSALQTWERTDYGGDTTQPPIRYKDDVYDRLWFPVETPNLVTVETELTTDVLSNNDYKPPPVVMRTAVTPVGNNDSLVLSWTPPDTTSGYYVYLHFFEVDPTVDVPRQFSIDLNDKPWSETENLPMNDPLTVFAPAALKGVEIKLTIAPTNVSTFPPLLNAVEIYIETKLQQLHTQLEDVDAMMSIKNSYKIISNWQGDPCLSEDYLWDGLKCNNDQNPSTIISLNLAQRELTGEVAQSISNLSSLESLDLSYNNLSGTIPAFLADMPSLKVLNLAGNKFTGSVPQALLSKNGSTLTLSVGENPYLCVSPCGTKKSSKNMYIVPVSIISVLVLGFAVGAFFFWKCRRIGSQGLALKPNGAGRTLKSKNQRFSYSEVVSITNNFERVIGKGGFGTVYLGHLEDGIKVAVKVLSLSSTQGSEQFWTEAELLTTIHHRNLASLIGYCDEASNTALVYEYMVNGNLQEYLLDRNRAVLTWERRLQIAVDAAHALEYLHDGCKPPIIHRDIKTSNILLDDKLQAKVSDFGLSRIFPIEDGDHGTHVTTAVMGTRGYLDPEYDNTRRLTKKSDVYSFGVVLLELITGQPAIIKSKDSTHIVQWVTPMIERGEISNIADPRLEGEFDSNSMWKALEAAMACVPDKSLQRLNMSDVVGYLNECLEMGIASGRDLEMTEISKTTSSNGTNMPDVGSSVSFPQAR